MNQNFGWIEIVVFAGIALGFGVWQLISINLEIARDKAAKQAAKQAATKPEPDSTTSPGHAEGQHHLDNG
jgi:hypothetical protein